MIATGFPAIDPSKRPKKEAGDYRDGRRGGKAAAQPCGNRAAAPISAAKISQLGCMAPVRERGGVSLSFANDVSERSLDLLRCNTGSGDFLSCAGPTPSLGPFVAPRLSWRNAAACAHARPKSTRPWSLKSVRPPDESEPHHRRRPRACRRTLDRVRAPHSA